MPLSWAIDVSLHDFFDVVEVLNGTMFRDLEDFSSYAVDQLLQPDCEIIVEF